jgi:hypothetical protein
MSAQLEGYFVLPPETNHLMESFHISHWNVEATFTIRVSSKIVQTVSIFPIMQRMQLIFKIEIHFSIQNGEPNSWICYDFKDMAVTPSYYSIMSCTYGPNHGHQPRSWCLEVSGDCKSWMEIHRCENNKDLNGQNQIGTYSVPGEVRSRFVRLLQTGKTHSNCDCLVLSGFEFFGFLHECWIWVQLHIAPWLVSSSGPNWPTTRYIARIKRIPGSEPLSSLRIQVRGWK